MKGIIFTSGLFSSLLTSSMLLPVSAQVTSDGTTNTTVNTNGNNFTIINGIQKSNNLFHSFNEFSIPTGGSAVFNNSATVENIINRVTGGNISNIDGLIKANGNANLFLINPAGIIFGKNSRLDIGGSFLGTTAESILFEDGFEFSAVNPQSEPLLTVSVPVGLQMGGNSGDIQVNGSGYSLNRLRNLSLNVVSNSNLQVESGKTLALVGKNITMMDSRVSTNSGKIELGSVNQGLVDLIITSTPWKFSYEKVSQFGEIKLEQAIIDAITPGGGSIELHAENISVNNGSNVVIQNQGFQKSGGININAAESLEIIGKHPEDRLFSNVTTEGLLGSTGDISIATQRLISSGGITSQVVNVAGSNIIINASESIKLEANPLEPRYTSAIETASFGKGNAGNIIISTGNLDILDGSRVSSVTRSQGDSGDVTINSKSIQVTGTTNSFLASLISAGSLGEGNAGNLLINTDRLIVRNGGRVDSSTAAQGNAGNVTINANEFVEVDGTVTGSINPSLIISSANLLDESLRRSLRLPDIPRGESGSLTINTPQLRVTNGALVTVKNDGTGNAGNLTVNANSIFLNEKGGITAATESGEGGDINLNLQDSLILRRGSFIDTESFGVGNGGNITVNSPAIAGLENSDIIANAFQGNGGNINITTQGIFGLEFRDFLTYESDITASSQFGVSGTVKINNLSIDPSSGLVELPVELTDPSQQIANSCTNTDSSSFIVTGRGGIPQNPNQQVNANIAWSDVRNLSAYRNDKTNNSKVTETSNQSEIQPQIIEATGLIRNENGDFQLIASESKRFINKQVANCSG